MSPARSNYSEFLWKKWYHWHSRLLRSMDRGSIQVCYVQCLFPILPSFKTFQGQEKLITPTLINNSSWSENRNIDWTWLTVNDTVPRTVQYTVHPNRIFKVNWFQSVSIVINFPSEFLRRQLSYPISEGFHCYYILGVTFFHTVLACNVICKYHQWDNCNATVTRTSTVQLESYFCSCWWYVCLCFGGTTWLVFQNLVMDGVSLCVLVYIQTSP